MFLQNTSYNTIAVWKPNSLSGFSKPIILSTGTGTETFFNLDDSQNQIKQIPSINRTTLSFVNPALVTGTCFFHVQSDALIAIREILEDQSTKGVAILGTAIILCVGSLTATKYDKFVWTSVFTGANINQTCSDVSIKFSCKAPTQISIGAVASIATSLAGLL